MTEDASAGRLHLDVVADVSGLRADLKTKAEAAIRGLRLQGKVKAQVEFSSRQVRDALSKALAEGAKARPVKAQVEFSGAQVRAALSKAMRDGSATGNTVRALVEFSGRQARAALNDALREGGSGANTVRARVEFSGTQARAALNNALREGGSGGGSVRARVEFSGTQARAALSAALREGASGGSVAAARVRFSPAQVRAALAAALQEGGTGGNTVTARVRFAATQVRAALAVALREATAGAAGGVLARVRFSPSQVRAALAAALREATKENPALARVQFSASQVRAALNRALREAMAGTGATIRLRGDAGRLLADAAAARRAIESRPVRVRIEHNLHEVGTALQVVGVALRALSLFPAIASGVLVLAGALTNLAGALFAVTSAASQAVGVLGIIPSLAGAAMQGIGTLLIGFSGIGDALKAMTAADKQAGRSAQTSANQQVDAVNRIKQARQRLADARQQAAQRVADAERQGAERIASAREQGAERIAAAEKSAAREIEQAERSRADAIRNARRAEEELSRARERAREEIQQLAFSLREASLSEEQAQINLERAQRKVIQARQSAVMSPLDRRQAELDYRQAILDLEEAKDRTSDLAKENAKARREGVEGSEDVRDAKERLADANRDIADAERDLDRARREGAAEVAKARRDAARDIAKAQADSARDIARARQEGARQVRDAQQALTEAMRSTAQQAGATSAAMGNLDHAMSRLGPAGQRFARFLHSTLLPRLRELRNAVQEALLPRMEKAITAAMPLLGTLQKGFVATAKTIGDAAIRFGELAGSAPFRRDTATIMASNNRVLRSFGEAAFHLFDALRHVLVVAGPFAERFARLVAAWARGRAEAAALNRENGRMAAWFERSFKTGSKLWTITKNLATALRNVAKAATPTGDTILDSLARATDRLARWTADPRNQQRMHEFFAQTVPMARELAHWTGELLKLLVKLAEAVGGDALAGFFAAMNAFLDVLNAIADMPAGGTILSTILLMAGAGLALGLVARALGRILRGLAAISRLSGLSRVAGLLFGGGPGGRRGPSQVGRLADDVERLTGEIDRELPKDRRKQQALGGVGGAAGKARKPVSGVAGDMRNAGDKADEAGKKASRFSRILSGLRGVAGRAGGALAGLGAAFLAIPGLGGAVGRLGSTLKNAFAKIKLPSLGGKAVKPPHPGDKLVAGKAVKGGFLATTIGGLLGKMPGLSAVLARVRTWFGGLLGGIRSAASKIFSKSALTNVLKGGAKGGAKGGVGGPIGIIGGILAGIVGQLIGGGKGGARGATGGAISGAATGAGIGVLLGTIVPGIGNVIGAALGAVVGAIVGAITGGKWWGAIGRFFTQTLPGYIVTQARESPGRVAGLLRGAVDLGAALITWAGGQLKRFGVWLGGAILATIRKIPVLIVEAIFAIPRLIAAAAARAPLVFAWILKQAVRLIPMLARWGTAIPRFVVKAILGGAFKAGMAFGWILLQMRRVPGQVVAIARRLPGQIMHAIRNPGDVFAWLKRQATSLAGILPRLMRKAATAVKDALSAGLGDAGKRAAQRMAEISKNFRLARDRWKTVFRDAMNSVRKTVSDAFTYVRNSIADRLNSARAKVSEVLGRIRSSFNDAKNYISRKWGELRGAVKTPINYVIGVYNNGIKRLVEGLAGAVGSNVSLPKVNYFARGGIMPGYSPGRDSLLAAVSPGESIFRPEFTRAVGPEWVDLANQIARTKGAQGVRRWMQAGNDIGGEGIAFARGGIAPRPRRISRLPGFAGHFAFGGIVNDLIDGVKNFTIGNVEKAARSALGKIIAGHVPGSGQIRDVIARIPHWIKDSVLKWVKTKIASFGGGPSMERALAWAKTQHGKHYQWGGNGNPSWDCSGFMSAIESVIRGERPHRRWATSSFNGGTPPGWHRNARSGFMIGVLDNGNAHASHTAGTLLGVNVESSGSKGVRVGSSARGFRDGMFPWKYGFKRDSGGSLPPGTSLVHNGHRRNEWVLTPQAVDLLGGERAVQALNRIAAVHGASRAAPVTAAGSDGARAPIKPTVHVHPQPGQSETEIAMITARKLGAMLQ